MFSKTCAASRERQDRIAEAMSQEGFKSFQFHRFDVLVIYFEESKGYLATESYTSIQTYIYIFICTVWIIL